ncbi:hypothetical protein P618_200121 [Holospora obtusa F1]|uniref:Uncharacterized protein n=1 Tax=Holospora obtusa F1 TaxID=1399147 RepID=W6TEI6_HOLOB|nr:hypothetical protein [Holospora obtusa]ETZ07688.1 hypothetical protein P618_200121 [Holospora obtusa F1]
MVCIKNFFFFQSKKAERIETCLQKKKSYFRNVLGGIFLLGLLCFQVVMAMGNPFSFQVDGVDFSEATTSEEKADWANLVDKGMDKMKAARQILRKKNRIHK